MPQINPPTNPVRLFRLAEAVARNLAEQHEDLRHDEAMLRAAIAWAKHAQTAHVAIAKRAKTNVTARLFVEPARRRRIRAADHLRLRLTMIARKFGLMREAQARQRAAEQKDQQLLKIADLALSLVPQLGRELPLPQG
jgi:hypothetical protein